jgi:capsular polysaccharide transport system permease protein
VLYLVLFFPTIFAVFYFGLVASDRYVSEAQFVVRTASKPAGGAGLGALLQMTGLGRTQEDVFSVQSYMGSRNAVEQLASRVALRAMFNRPGADWIARYPSLIYGTSAEELHKYLGWMISTTYLSTTGITTLKVQAFRPDDARNITLALLQLGEETVNKMNERIHKDAVLSATTEVQRSQDRLLAAQLAITRFRNAELMIDPAGSSIIITELIARLAADLTQTEAQIREVSASAATNPQLPSLRRRTEALQAQITRERQKISGTGGPDGLADKLAAYERLVLDREFAKQALTVATRASESAQLESRRQQLYIERIVEPVAADRAMAPERWRMIFSVFAVNCILAMVGWLVVSGLSEHATNKHS